MDIILEYWLRFGINLAIISLLIAVLFWRHKQNRSYAFGMIVSGALVYVVIRAMMQIEIGLGVGFGIFAIFSLLRFRTVAISLRDMTYLFVTITLSLVNAMFMYFDRWEEMLAVNIAIAGTLIVLEYGKFLRYRASMTLAYDSLDLLHPAMRRELFADIQQRTGIKPQRIAIDSINLKRKSARLRVWYVEED